MAQSPKPRKQRAPDLEIEQILEWADAHYTRTGTWPRTDDGFIPASPRDKWQNVDAALRVGLRSLPGGSSLARLLAQHRGVRNRKALPPYTEEQILEWADAYHDRTGRWPMAESGPIEEAPGETWTAVAVALVKGLRGLPGGSSLPQLLAARRQVRNVHGLPPLTEEQILAWADGYNDRTRQWPMAESGPIAEAPGETWNAVNQALRNGNRGLPGGSSLARLLDEQRGVRNRMDLPRLTVAQILAWADAHLARTGAWPKSHSGAVAEAPEETWSGISAALNQGARGLPGGSSLAHLLWVERGVRHHLALPELTARQILAWADAHYERTGRWPNVNSGAIEEAPGELWAAVNSALEQGHRGLPGGASLAKLLAKRRGLRNPADLPPLTVKQILAWADAYHRREGKWPIADAGPIAEAPGETWMGMDVALRVGSRGLLQGSSLARLLNEQRGVRNVASLPRLTVDQILAWADAYHTRTGQWPTRDSAAIEEAPGELWSTVNAALISGNRGLPGGSSLARLLGEHRGVRNIGDLPPLAIAQILAWADAHHGRAGEWPTAKHGGMVVEAPHESWHKIDTYLRLGLRTLPGGSSLARLLAQKRGVRNRKALPPYTEEQILAWAEAHHARAGRWPTGQSGPIADAPGETWTAVDVALSHGQRGLPGGSSLSRLLREHGKTAPPRRSEPPGPSGLWLG
jgi:hypothetical protein